MNYLGYRLLQEGKADEAIQVFLLNIEAFPKSANVYDGLAEACVSCGNTQKARTYYEKVLEILAEDSQIDEDAREVLMNNAKYVLKNMEI